MHLYNAYLHISTREGNVYVCVLQYIAVNPSIEAWASMSYDRISGRRLFKTGVLQRAYECTLFSATPSGFASDDDSPV